MEKINFLECEEFLEIKKLMGISDNDKTNFTIVIDANDPNLKITPSGYTYKGRRVILYIRDQPQYFHNQGSYKFHLIDCQTLSRMKTQGYYGKYVISTETSGIFTVTKIINGKKFDVEEKLEVCKHCLQKLNWNSYNSAHKTKKNFICKNFSIEDFFEFVNEDNQLNFSDIPEYTDKTAPLNDYPKNWSEISLDMKKKYNYTCQECHKNFSNFKNRTQLLEVHHLNGLKYDCREENLQVLCADCHQKRHSHKISGSSRNNFYKLPVQESLF